MYEIEAIPDESFLFLRVHNQNFRDGRLLDAAFVERGVGNHKGISTNWDKYSTAQQTLDESRNPKSNGVVAREAGKVRDIGMQVTHAPLWPEPDNQAHTNLTGLGEAAEKTHRRNRLAIIFNNWKIPIF